MFKKYTILSLPGKNSHTITFSDALKKDVVRWAAIVLLVMIPYVAYAFVLSLAYVTQPSFEAFQKGLSILMSPMLQTAIVLAAVLWARWVFFDVYTWVLVAILTIFYTTHASFSATMLILPNSPFTALVAMIGFLAIFRIVEYQHMRRIIKVEYATMTNGAYVVYGATAVICLLATSSIAFELFYLLFGHQGPS